VGYQELLRDPAKYRGRVLHLEGWVKRLRRWDAPAYLVSRGIHTLYEAWVYGQPDRHEPWNVVLTELPEGFSLGDEVNYPVVVDGYFFKALKERFGTKDLSVPQLLTRTLRERKAPEGSALASAFSVGFVTVLTALAAVIIVILAGLAWWFRRGDRRLQARLAALRTPPNLESLAPNGGPGATPSEPGALATGGAPPPRPTDQPFHLDGS
jgi:hypothetical protein